MSNGLEEMAAAFDPHVRDLASRTRSLIVDVYPEVVEAPWPRQNVAGYGVGPKEMSEHFCYIALHKDHINLGFNQGVELPDPKGLLEGPGRRCATRRYPKPKISRTPRCAACWRRPWPTACRPARPAGG